MGTYAVRRTGQGLIVVIVVSFITFIEAHLLPGNPARAILGVHASSAQIQAFDIENGYNKALPIQYVDYAIRLLRGNLGFSYVLNQSVASLLAERLPATVILVGLSVLVSLIAAIPLAVLQAVRRNRPADYVLTGFTFAFYSMPTFWLGLMFVMLLAVKAHVFPPIAPQGGPVQILQHPQGLVLPVLTLALGNIAAFSRYLRSSLLDNLAMDYVRTARAIGSSNRRALYVHVFKNALAPVITLIGLSLPGILSGALITESIFNYPGMGLLYWNSALSQDYPVLLGVTIVVAVGTVAGSLIADLLYAVADPRIRYGRPA
ncbi:MAG TPA: ABC transporter permease [Streptosporangiaceae bacterium]|jgi:peptide/nickel transport system permease protein|nr:ABC transporter permease [Streptosporangiaceae bacterium]